MNKPSIYNMGVCSSCQKPNVLIKIFGLSSSNLFDFICQNCLDSLSNLGPFKNCENCRCLVNIYFPYPSGDVVVGSQKPYCKLCYELKMIEETIINSTPRKERKAFLKVLKEKEKNDNS